MSPHSEHPPVLFLAFNRPAEAERVLTRILAADPVRLYVAVDGPRAHVPADAELCAATRSVITRLTQNCSCLTLFRDSNLGCRDAVSSAIAWFFAHEEYGVVLEDDCLPHPAFFSYMSWALERFRSDPRVWHVSGMGIPNSSHAPFALATIPFIWGWGTWRDRWQHYQVNLADPLAQIVRTVRDSVPSAEARDYWTEKFAAVKAGRINTWDYQWGYQLWRARAYALTPAQSFVENIGFSAQSTHTPADTIVHFSHLIDHVWAPPPPDWAPPTDDRILTTILERIFHLHRSNLAHRWNRLMQHPWPTFIRLAWNRRRSDWFSR